VNPRSLPRTESGLAAVDGGADSTWPTAASAGSAASGPGAVAVGSLKRAAAVQRPNGGTDERTTRRRNDLMRPWDFRAGYSLAAGRPRQKRRRVSDPESIAARQHEDALPGGCARSAHRRAGSRRSSSTRTYVKARIRAAGALTAVRSLVGQTTPASRRGSGAGAPTAVAGRPPLRPRPSRVSSGRRGGSGSRR
jgi:hypothetical protein